MHHAASDIVIALYNQHALLKESMAHFIPTLGNFTVSVHSSDPQDFLKKMNIAPSVPDVCIIDLPACSKSGWGFLKAVRDQCPAASIGILSELQGKDIVQNLVSYKADGYIPKDSSAAELTKALTELSANGYYYPPAVAKLIHQHIRGSAKKITDKEHEFLTHCVKDLTLAEIADLMYLSPRTVDNYRDSLYTKLNVRTRTGLALFAIKTGIADTAGC